MQRLLFLLAVLVGFTTTALAQGQRPAQSSSANSWTRKSAEVERSRPLPPAPVPLRQLRGYDAYYTDDGDLGSLSDTLNEAQILRRLGRLYRYQADILAAQADDDDEHVEGLLDLAMTEIGTLTEQPNITERPRFRELYRTLVSEYERYYGTSDTVLYLSHGGVYELRAEIFALLDEIEEPLLEDVTLPTLPPMATVVPMTTNRVVEQTINYFLNKKRNVLVRWMGRADTYFPMIEQIFREEGVPDELKYLALVESGLNPRARSWARAVGMWQFISQTGGAYGLHANTWVDDRMNPEKATRAAARHLKDLYAQYGNNWHVALAGYNCSPRCIKRAIRRAGGTVENPPSYWEMYPYLPRETRGYVPQFIAFSLIMSNPSAFGLTNVPQGPRYAYDLVPVKGMLSLGDVAEMTGTDVATIQALNPELRQATLPPSQSAYELRIPLGSYAQFAEAFRDMPEETKRPVSEYVVRRGDSLGKIGQKHGVSVAALKNVNNLRSSTIHPGQHLIVPVPSYTGPVSLAEGRPVSVEYGIRTIRPIEPLAPLAVNTEPPPVVLTSGETNSGSAPTPARSETSTESASTTNRVVYRVRRGDTLGKIGQKYGVSVQDLQRWNNLRGTRIKSGQRLTIYSSGSSGSSAASSPERVVYRVRRGDALSTIAQKYGVSITSIKQWNNLRSNTIKVGQRLTIHPGQSAPNYVVYEVRRGDSLGKIAKKYRTSVSKIKQWNDLRSSTIRPGQQLKIYSAP